MLSKDKLLEYLSLGDRINFFGKVFSDLGITDKVFEDGYTFDLPPCVEHTTDRLRSIIRQAVDGPIVIVNSEYSRASHAEHIEELIRSEFVNPKNIIWIHNGMNFPETPFINIDIPMLTAIHERNFMYDILTKGFDRPIKNQLPDGKGGIGWRFPYTYLPGSSLSPEKSFLYLWFKSLHQDNRIYMDTIPNLAEWPLIKEQMLDKYESSLTEKTAITDLYDMEKTDEMTPPQDWMYNWFEARHQIAWWSKVPVARIDEQEAATYFNIIRETMPLDSVQCFSEKTFKPILFGSLYTNPFFQNFGSWMKQYGIKPYTDLEHITESDDMIKRLRAMIDFVNDNGRIDIKNLYEQNLGLIDENYNFIMSGDFFEHNMNRIDHYVEKV